MITARRRAESIQNVPIAVTAVSGDALARANITDVNAMATQVPSLVITAGSSGSKAIPTFAIRGQSQQELSILADPSVPVYFNDVVVERQQGVNSSLFDIQSVEVLKGPQGTLFGRNSTGGAINIKANTPSEEFEGYVGTTVGNLGRFNTTAMVNQPLTDWAQLRVAGQTTDSDGYLKDVVLDKEINNEHTKAGRVSLAVQPMDGMNSLFTFSRFIEDDGGTGAEIVTLNPGSLANATKPDGTPNGTAAFLGYTGSLSGEQMVADQQARGIYKTASGADQFTRVSTRDIANTTTYDINDGLSVKNIVGNRRVTGGNFDDVDGMPIPLIQIARYYDFNQISEEFQLLGKTDTLNWIVGAYYFHEAGGTDDYSITVKPANTSPGNQIPQPVPQDFPGWTLTDPDGKNTSKSVFAQATQKLDNLVEGLSFTAGGRYTWDDREATIRNRSGNASNPNGPEVCRFSRDLDSDPSTPETPANQVPIDECVVSFKKSFSEPTWNLSLDYQFTPHNLLYLANRRGYRTGGFGARAATEDALSKTFNPETVTDVEIGSKNDFRLGEIPLRLNAAVYYSDYKDIQRLLTDPTTNPPQTIPVNAAKATIKGAEVEFTILPTDNTEISGFYSYTDASYDEFIDPLTGADISNQPFARAPKNVYSITGRYTLPTPAEIGKTSVQVNYFHTAGYSASDTYAPEQSVDAYGLLNLRADWNSVMRSGFDLGFFVKNALDKEYLNAFGDIYTSAAIGIVTRTPGEPRSFGLDIRYRFGAQGG
ncbi:TonB-dependent receptor [Hydrocarboniphaga sp.]|uniref:TonB-dependent receptor n=1 Tax=Hydrocarboniphaga sp. TaxID=2033016 RepID=UPI00262AD3A4|nr:TonB-dependent receptor [Hydrocarboniphaga sp.]